MKVALVGNQNAGKTTLFNALTGSNQKIGNWPGVTIERKIGILKGSEDIEIVDLPGIYSLSPYTSEEDVSRKYVLEEKPDLILNIIDATSLERSLYLTTQLLELDCDVVIALNMEDILLRNGITINDDKLSHELGASIVSISAKTGKNIDNLINLIKSRKYRKNEQKKIYPDDIEEEIFRISSLLGDKYSNKRFISIKIMENDRDFGILSNSRILNECNILEQKYDMDIEQLFAAKRYDYIEAIKKKTTTYTPVKESITDKLDKLFLNKYLAIPLFILIMTFVCFISVGVVGQLTTSLIDAAFNGGTSISIFNYEIPLYVEGLTNILSNSLSSWGASPWAISLINDGMIGGISAVLNFLPQIMMLFFCLTILEATGYMTRIAFFLDRVFHKFGLSGKSLIPFIVGSGCSVPGVMASRIVEDNDEKKLTILLTPFIPCSAKLPIMALFTSYFFGSLGWLVSASMYVMAVVIILISGIILKKLVYKGHSSTFVSELPSYKLPNFKYVFRDVYDKTISFIKRAGTVILLCSIIVWVLSSFTWDYRYVDGLSVQIDQSMLAGIGNAFAWMFYPMLCGNYSWGAAVSALQGLVAKEQVISSMTVISSIGGYSEDIFSSSMFSFFNSWSAFAFMTFNLFCSPCIGAISAMRKEFGSNKEMFKAIGYQTGLAWVIATIIGCLGWLTLL